MQSLFCLILLSPHVAKFVGANYLSVLLTQIECTQETVTSTHCTFHIYVALNSIIGHEDPIKINRESSILSYNRIELPSNWSSIIKTT